MMLAACSSGGSSSSAAPSVADESQAPASEPAASAEPTEAPAASLTVGVAPAIFSYLPTYVAADKGFWAEENLDVELVILNSGTDMMGALTADELDAAAASYSEPIVLTAQGVPTVIIATIEDALPYRLMSSPDITDIQQLEGKIVGVSRIGSLSDQVSRIVLNQAGVDLSTVTFQGVGGSPDRLAALEAGAIDAALFDAPTWQIAEEAGMSILVNVAEELEGFPYEMFIAKKEAIEANEDVYLRLVVGLIKGAQYATDPANKAEVLEIVSGYTGQEVADLDIAYEDTIADFPPDMAIDLAGIEQALAGTVEFGDVEGADELTAEELIYPALQEEAATILGID
jgi:NitT/TauT family transport system substrate-binding protein